MHKGIGSVIVSLFILSLFGFSQVHKQLVARQETSSRAIALAETSGTHVQFAGVPLVQNYPKTDYKAANQNWSVSCAENGMMHFANTDGLLSFDGQHWERRGMPGNVLVRAVATDRKERIYTGGFGQFGFWDRDKYGALNYHSLSNTLSEKDRPNDEIWKIYVDQEKILFQSFSSIYTYQDGELSVFKSSDPFLFLFRVGERYLVEVIAKGLFEFDGKKLVKLLDKEVYGNARVLSILPYAEKSLLIGTAQKGVFVLHDQELRPWKNEVDDELKKFQLNNGLHLIDGYYAFGTILNGIYILDEGGNLVQHINKSNGLQNNTVLSLQSDKEHNIWVGLDNGISRIEINSPIYYYDDRSGNLGTVYSSKIHNGNLYLGTNQGLYYSAWPAVRNHFNFHLIEGTQGQVWDLSLINGELFCGHNNGTFIVQGPRVRWLSSITGGYLLEPLEGTENLLLQGTYTGLALFNKQQNGSWNFQQQVENFNEPAQYLQQTGNNRLWVSGYKGLYRIQLNDEQNRVIQKKQYMEQEGLPNTPYVNVFDLAGRTVFATDSGFYLYDEIADHFHAYDQLNERLGTFANANKIVAAEDGQYWFIRKGNLALATFGNEGKVSIDSTQFGPLSNRMISYYENVNALTPQLSLISLDDGFALYRRWGESRQKGITRPIIQKVEDISDSTAHLVAFNQQGFVLDAKQNNLRITFSLPHYSINEVQFQYLLEGNSRNWSEWSTLTQKEFTNLPQGEYIFKVRALLNGVITPIQAIDFVISAPWYLSVVSLIVYFIVFLLLLLGLRKMYYYKLKKHREEVQQKMLLGQEERLRKESIENEQRLVRLKNSQLEKELAGKNRELANSAMNIVYKNELLNNVHDELLLLKDQEGRKLSSDQLKKIRKIIDDARSDERDWNLFEDSFNEAHENFFKKLKIGHPELIPNDLKLCAYLRMNMSSKEIASLLNISTRGVEIRRYRLRKKLNLDHDQNLTEFLIEI